MEREDSGRREPKAQQAEGVHLSCLWNSVSLRKGTGWLDEFLGFQLCFYFFFNGLNRKLFIPLTLPRPLPRGLYIDSLVPSW